MSAKQRRQQKKLRQQQLSGKVVDPDDQDHTDQVTAQPAKEPIAKDTDTDSKVSKRGKRAKAQKIKAKYSEQVDRPISLFNCDLQPRAMLTPVTTPL